jgi:uncharacterized membrane protein
MTTAIGDVPMLAPLLAFGLGVVAGSRTFLAPTAVSWGISRGWLSVPEPRLSLLGHPLAPKVLTGLALGELVGDKLPATPSRTNAAPFAARVISGALSGAAIGSAGGALLPGLLAGAVGAGVGTLGLRATRGKLAGLLGRDLPAALLEDSAAIAGGLVLIRKARALRAPSAWDKVAAAVPRMLHFG